MPDVDIMDGVSVAVESPIPDLEMELPSIDLIVVPVSGPQGATGSASATWHHTQVTPASVWPVAHNLGRKPPVVILVDQIDPTRPVEADIEYLDDDNLNLVFPVPYTGHAYM